MWGCSNAEVIETVRRLVYVAMTTQKPGQRLAERTCTADVIDDVIDESDAIVAPVWTSNYWDNDDDVKRDVTSPQASLSASDCSVVYFNFFIIIRLHRMHEMQPIVTDVCGICPSVCLSCSSTVCGAFVQSLPN